MTIRYFKFNIFFICIFFILSISNISFAQDPYPGTALDFDGSNDYANCGNPANLSFGGTAPFTIEAWVKPNVANADGYIFTKYNRYINGEYRLGIGGGLPWFHREVDPWNIVGTTNLQQNTWYHIAAVYDGTNMILYVNGNAEAFIQSGAIASTSNNVLIGAQHENNSPSGFLNGEIEEVRVWNVARNTYQILGNMHLTLSGSEPGLVSYWQFNDSTGTTVIDPVSSNNGTLVNMDNSDWIPSNVAVGSGHSHQLYITTPGTYSFVNTGLSMEVTSLSQNQDITVTRIDLAPNVPPTYAIIDTFDSQYWIVHDISDGTYTANFTFTPSETITVGDEADPSSLRLFVRTINSDGSWDNFRGASSASVSNNTVTFNTLSSSNQFIIARHWFDDFNAGFPGVYGGSVDWGDYDNDGDIDIVMTGGYPSRVYRNDSGVFTDINAGLRGISSGSAKWGDYDNDGDLDILLCGSYYSIIYCNDSGIFSDINAGLLGLYSCSIDWGDFDNDGDLDILLTGRNSSNACYSIIYRNDLFLGNHVFTAINDGLHGVHGGSVDWGDYDNDGDLDILMTGAYYNGPIQYFTRIYRNDGASADPLQWLFTDISAGLTNVTAGAAEWGDYDCDGDLDALITGVAGANNYISKIYRNESGIFTDINAGLLNVFYGSAAWGDYDNDGDLDILLTGSVGFNSYRSRIFRNDAGVFTDVFAMTGVQASSVAWGDYDNDNDLDFLITGGTNVNPPHNPISRLYQNNGHNPNTTPSSPTGLTSAFSSDSLTFSWGKSNDNETPQNGLSYNVFLGNSEYDLIMKPPMANLDNGYRQIVSLGNACQVTNWTSTLLATYFTYPQVVTPDYWGVQAIDHAFAGSPFSLDSINIPISSFFQLNNFESLGLNDSLFIESINTNSILSYQIQIDDDSLFNTPEVNDTIFSTSVALNELIGNDNLIGFTTYYWRIKPHYSFGLLTLFTQQPENFIFRSQHVLIDTLHINLSEGWNMIGAPNWDLLVTDIIDPDTIIVPNTLYMYEDYYVSTIFINPGMGYWIMASDSGKIKMIRGHFGSSGVVGDLINLEPFTSIQITDASDHKRELFLNSSENDITALENPEILKSYNLPPLTNQNMFDVRFINGKYLSERGETTIELQSSDYPIEIEISNLPQSDKINYVLHEMAGEEIVKTHDLRNRETLIISQPNLNNSTKLKITKQSLIPEQFALGQNYPNPFNPVTTIPYALPEKSKVIIDLYDMIGRKIKNLVNEKKEAGYYTYDFKPNNLASGVYIYRIQAGQFSAKKKLLLIK